VVHSVSIGWNAYLSLVRHREMPSKSESLSESEADLFQTSLEATHHRQEAIIEQLVSEQPSELPQ
jgi:hypothetical protein